MKCSVWRDLTFSALLPAALLWFASAPLFAQEGQKPEIIDLDKVLQEPLPQNRAESYYHYSLAKWYEDQEEFGQALSEMKEAVRFNENDSSLRVELAEILAKNGNVRDAVVEAENAAGLNPVDPEPHWFLANIYLRSGGNRPGPDNPMLQKAIAELEAMKEIAPDDERPYYALGRAYFDLGKPERAIEAFEQFQTLVPDSDFGYLQIAQYYQQEGNDEKAVEYFKKAIRTQPDSIRSLLPLANLYAKQGKNEEAIPLYRKILEFSGDSADIKKRLGSSLLESGEAREAADLLEGVVKASPQDIGAKFDLGRAYEQSGRTAEAIKIFSELLEETEGTDAGKQNRLVFQQYLAGGYQEAGEYQKAIAIYQDMVKNDPSGRAVFLLINAYRIDRQYEKALELGKKEYEKNPDEVNIALVYARTLGDAGKTREGSEILEQLLEANPSNLDVYINLSQIYVQGKDFTDAEAVLRRAAEKDLDRERVKFQLATVYERQQDFDRAESLFKEILKENPKNATALNYIGYMLADRGTRLEEAVRYVQEALALDPDNGAYLDSLGWAFFKLDELEKAEKYLLQADEIVKNDPVIHEHLGDLYFKIGDYDKARSYWLKSVENGTEEEETNKVREKLQKLQETLREMNQNK